MHKGKHRTGSGRHTHILARSGPRPLSDDPTIAWLHRSLPELFLLTYWGFIIYCSLLPFGPSWGPLRFLGRLDWSGLSSTSAGLKDILPNILLYVPLGAVGYVVARRAEWGRAAAMISGSLLCIATSVVVEVIQQEIPARVPSWVDVACNTIGGVSGAMLGRACRRLLNRMLRFARFELRHEPLSTTARVYVVLIVLTGIIPLDFTYDISRIGIAAKKANFVPFRQFRDWDHQARQAELSDNAEGFVTLRRIKTDYWLDMTAEVATFGLLGVLLAAGCRREHQTGRFEGWLFSTFNGAMAALGLSVLQFFIISRGFDATEVVMRTLAVSVLAAVTVHCVSGQPRSAPDPRYLGLRRIDRRTARWLTAGVVLYIFSRGFSPFMLRSDMPAMDTIWNHVNFLPMAGYFESRISTSVDDVLYKLLRYAVYGFVAAVALGLDTRRPFRRRAWRIALCAGAMATLIELCQVYLPTRWPDLTHVLLAVFGAYGGAIGARWLNDYYHAVRGRWLVRLQTASDRPVFNVEIPAPAGTRPASAADLARRKEASSGTGLNVDIPPPDESISRQSPGVNTTPETTQPDDNEQ
ncbi:MAG: VanZ family protein [Phycisphaerae bacterium]|nr:VanZ family protein [Phycisphaerae bacterium]